MIGYYVHHQGSGHLHRAQSVAAAWGEDVTGLSTLPRPPGWPGEWVQLADDAPTDGAEGCTDVTADDHLHWVPVGHRGLSERMSQLSSWLDAERPNLVVSDHSVEVTLLARLHGVRVVGVVLPGARSDRAHLLGYGVCDALVAMWPESAGMSTGLPWELRSRLRCLGGLSRFAPVAPPTPPADERVRPHVVVLWGRGGDGPPARELAAAREHTPAWTWTVLGGQDWVDSPFAVLRSADVVLTHAGQNAVAETAAARRPAIVLPQPRPFDEQEAMGHALRDEQWPALVLASLPTDPTRWAGLLERARALDGEQWRGWCDGGAAERFARVLREVDAA